MADGRECAGSSEVLITVRKAESLNQKVATGMVRKGHLEGNR